MQAGAALAKGLFPALGPAGTVGLRIGLSALILLAAFRPPLRRMTAAQWRLLIPYGVVLGIMNMVFYFSLSRIPLGLAVTVEFIGPLGVAVFGSRKAIDVVWVLLAGAGIALITPWTGGGVDPVGVLLAAVAGACRAASPPAPRWRRVCWWPPSPLSRSPRRWAGSRTSRRGDWRRARAWRSCPAPSRTRWR